MAACKLYTGKTAITAADLLNDRVLPFFAEHGISLLRILTDRGTEYCGKVENHAYQLYLAVEDVDHTRTKANSPQTNGICERFHRTIKDEFYDIVLRENAPLGPFLILITPQEALPDGGGLAGGSGRLAGKIQRAAAAFGTILLWQDAYADFPRNATYCQGQDNLGFRTIGQPPARSQHGKLRCPSDQV